MAMTDRLGTAFERFARRIGTTKRQRWKLGDGSGRGNVQNPTDPFSRSIWIHRDQSGEGREIGTAILDASSGILYANINAYENLEVDVSFPPKEELPHVTGLSTQTGYNASGGLTPLEQGLQAAAVPMVGNLATMRVDPSSYSSPTLICKTTAFFYTRPSSGQLYYHAADTLDFTATVGAIASGKHRYAWGAFDYESDTWSVVSSSDQTPTSTLPSRSDFNGTTFATLAGNSTQKRVAATYLYYGQTGVAEVDFYRSLDAKLDFPLWTQPDVNQIRAFARRPTWGEVVPEAFTTLRLRINGFLAKFTHTNTADRTYSLQDKSGTIAMTDDQPDLVQIEVFRRRPQGDGAGTGSSSNTQLDILQIEVFL